MLFSDSLIWLFQFKKADFAVIYFDKKKKKMLVRDQCNAKTGSGTYFMWPTFYRNVYSFLSDVKLYCPLQENLYDTLGTLENWNLLDCEVLLGF